jgi:SAM-dependent methyltransferase
MSDMQRWQLNGSAPEIYAEHLVPAIFARWAPIVLDAAGVEEGQHVLDVACGTGVVADGAAGLVGASGSVTGVDINPSMVAVAAVRSDGGIRWHQADAGALPFPGGSFDRVLCQAGVQYFPDRSAAVGEMRRVLRPGGRVVVLVWRALGSAVGPEAAAVMRTPFVFGDDPEPVTSLLRHAGFADVSASVEVGPVTFDSVDALVRYQCAGSPLATHVDVHDGALLSRLAELVAARLGAAGPGDPVEFPIEAHLARGTVATGGSAGHSPRPQATAADRGTGKVLDAPAGANSFPARSRTSPSSRGPVSTCC